MIIETVKMSSKGQIVIPQGMREELNAGEGTIFAIAKTESTVVLKKLETPSKEQLLKELKELTKEGAELARRKGIKNEQDIIGLIQKRRARGA